MYRDFTKYCLILIPLFVILATVQHMVVMDIPFTPSFYVVPIFVAIGFSFLGAKIKVLIKKNEAQKWETEIAQIQRMSTLGLYSSSIAHDLNNILHGINLGFDAKNKGMSTEKTDKHIANGLRRGEELVNQILTFAKGSSTEVERVDLNALLQEITGFAETFATQRVRISLVGEGEDARSTFVMGSYTQLYQVLLNLAVNAIQALKEVKEPTITLKLEISNGEALISVEDNGPGLPAEMQEKLFQPFTTAGKEYGSGIGLYISKRIITDHGGTLTYNPVALGLTRFEIRLPTVE